MKKIILFLSLILLLTSLVVAERYVNNQFRYATIDTGGNLITTSTPINNVDVRGYVCDSSGCSSVSGELWSGEQHSIGDFIQLVYPTTLMNPNGYGVYSYKDTYIPWETDADWWGTCSSCDPQGPFNAYLSRKEICVANIENFEVVGEEDVDISLDVLAPINHDGPLDYVPSVIEDHYKVDVDVNLEVTKDGSPFYTDSQNLDIFYSDSDHVDFSFSTAGPGTYYLNVWTETNDAKCIDYEIDDEDETIIIGSPAPYCGNNILDAEEECDDGNLNNGDGCSSNCEIEECIFDADCNDGLFCNGPEACIDSVCVQTTTPCTYDVDACTELTCNEILDVCIETPTPDCCISDSDCNNDYFSNLYCSNGNVWRNFFNFYCQNNICQNEETPSIFDYCGSNSCNEWGANYCIGNNSYHSRTCYNQGCSEDSCFSDESLEEELVEECAFECVGGICIDNPIICGDGIQEGIEECDDGNLISGDGCSSTCTIDCIPNMANTSWSSWINTTGCINDVQSQSRFLIKYDSNNCGASNETINQIREINCSINCIPNITNTSWSSWEEIGSCEDDIQELRREKIQYDINNCGASNETIYEYDEENCKCDEKTNKTKKYNSCGDLICDILRGENEINCPIDCDESKQLIFTTQTENYTNETTALLNYANRNSAITLDFYYLWIFLTIIIILILAILAYILKIL